MDFKQLLEKNAKADNAELAETEDPVISSYYATDRVKGSLICLELRLPEGRRKAVPYSFITGLNYDTEAGIEILTTREKITITGRNLSKLFDCLITYRVRHVQTNVGGDAQEEGLFVEAISIETLDH